MRSTFDPAILLQAAEAQALALDVGGSVWISANAGTGKTEVLTRRMLALLLADPQLEPRQILALTFTKAGAAEMAARLPLRLQAWADKDDAALAAEVAALGVSLPAGQDLAARVRQLAVEVRKAPPLVATIHGLAQHMLSRFTVEAGLPPDFEVLEDGMQKRLLREIQHDLLVQVQGPLAGYLATLLDELGEQGWEDLTRLVLTHWHRLAALVQGPGLAGVLAQLEQELGLAGREDAGQPLLPTAPEWAALRRVVAALPDTGARAVLEAPEALREDAWRSFLLTDKNTARARLFTKAELSVLDNADVAVLVAAAENMAEQVRLRRVYRGFDVTRAALLWAAAVRGAYVQRKQREGLVDYTDLLDGLERLLAAADAGLSEWVWYGLDRRFKHLVVDEAQDNNPQQDAIVQWLARSLLSGDVGDAAPRTVLAVGDMKQSIFRFQGAVPELFVRLREVMRDWAPRLREVELVHSFRSGQAVLDLVDRVFASGDSGEIVVGSDFKDWPAHSAVAATRPSRVELWPLVRDEERGTRNEGIAPWALPEERAAAAGHGADIACYQQLGAWLQQQVGRVVMPSTGKPLSYDDVMLVVQRNSSAAMAAGVLRRMGLPVASGGGVQPLEVDDAVACVRWIFDPSDNLALAQVLKGLRGWSDADLLALARRALPQAEAKPTDSPVWWEHVQGDDQRWLESLRRLEWHAPLAVVQTLARELGCDEHLLESLLSWAEGCTHLHELVLRLEQDDLPVNASGQGVKIYTVHGSKGLQAPLVILPDTMASLDDMRKDTLLWGEGVVLLKQARGLSELEDRLTAAEAARRRADSLRGLYVAMTRAMDWLVVTGFGEAKDKSDTWWTRVREGTKNRGTEEPDGVWVDGTTFELADAEPTDVDEAPLPLPGWLAQPLQREVRLPEQTAAQRRGDAVHALLQGLPRAVAPEVAAEAELVRRAFGWLWHAGARSEVAVAVDGRVGRIDRLVEYEGALWIIDFKTGDVPEQVPPAYVQQLQGYGRALRATYPARTLRAAIVWTAAPRLDEVELGC